MIIGKTQFSKISVGLVGELGYDSHGSCACHTDLKQTVNYAKGDEADRMKAAIAVQGIDMEEQKSK